jgi:DNA-directed RNA polymerase subunit beta
VHIERYEIQIHRTKLGVEEITQDIPNIAQKEIQNLDSFGIVKIGTWVEEGDILVGKITPINKKKISPYQKLLYTILEKQVKPFRDSSLRAPRGIKAKVIDIKFFYQSDKNPLFLSKLDFTKQQLKKRFSFDSVLAYSPPFRLCRSLCPYPFGAMDRSQKLKGTKAKFSFFPFDHNFLSLEKKAILKKKICEIKTNLEENKLLYEKKLTLPALFLNVSKNKHRSILYSDFDPYFFFPLEKESLLQPLSLLPQAKVSPFNRSERVGCPSIFGARARDRSPKGFTLTTETFPSFPRGGPKIKREGNTINLNEPFLYLSSDGKRQRKQPKAKNSIESVDFPSTSIRSARKNLYINKILKLNQEKNQHYWSHKLTKISTIHIYLAEKRKIQIGDKMAGRHGNKGIVSQILPIQDMPYLPDGTPIDMVLNPLGVPSRMNVGQIYECLLGLAGKYLGEHFKVFAFDEMYGPEASRSFVFNKLYYARQKTGFNWLFDPNAPGKMRLYDGRSGECFHQKITVGQAYILRLVHMVDDKMHMRSTGPYSLVTQQPLRGRSKQGGQRLGEMEVWALEGYGAAFSLLEMLTIKSDDMTGRMTLWSNLILNKEIAIGTPESFKVLVCELQALCLDIGLYRLKNTKQNEKQNFNIKNVSEKHYKTSLEEIDQLMNLL